MPASATPIRCCVVMLLTVLPLLAGEALTAGSVYPPMRRETATVHRLLLPTVAGTEKGLDLVLFSRAGVIAGGYALERGQAQVPLKIVAAPAGPHGIFDAGGTEIAYPKSLFNRYGYHQEDFRQIRSQVSAGKLFARRADDPAPLAWQADGGLAGHLDVVLLSTSVNKKTGLRSDLDEQPLRLRLQAKAGANGALRGSVESWTYAFEDVSYGAKAQRVSGELSGGPDKGFWEPSPAMLLPAGADWPKVHGPTGDMRAPAGGARLIDRIEDARLAWISEEIMAGSKGDRNKTEFGLGALVSNDMDGGGYSSPIIVGDRLFITYHLPDLDRIVGDRQWQDSILRIRGAPLGNASLGKWRQVVLCADARTGKTLWRTDWPFDAKEMPDEKQEKGRSPAYHDGVLLIKALGTLYGFDAANGKQLWKTQVGGRGVYWSCEESPTVIGGVALLGTADDGATGLAAFDPKTGKELWRQTRVNGFNAIPQAITLEGKPYILSACGASLRSGAGSAKPELVAQMGANPDYQRLVLIEPRSGRLVWEQREVGPNINTILLDGDIACCVVNREAYERGDEKGEQAKPERRPYPGGFRITLAGAAKLWEERSVAFDMGRNTPMTAAGCFVLDSRETGFVALDAKTGRIVGKAPHIHTISGGDHNWTWSVASGGQIITSGLLRWDVGADGLKQLPGQLVLPIAAGYVCPIKPALVDGRLFIRLKHVLACYDLRAKP
jgi:outer membrane protein assembly factor BamB